MPNSGRAMRAPSHTMMASTLRQAAERREAQTLMAEGVPEYDMSDDEVLTDIDEAMCADSDGELDGEAWQASEVTEAALAGASDDEVTAVADSGCQKMVCVACSGLRAIRTASVAPRSSCTSR